MLYTRCQDMLYTRAASKEAGYKLPGDARVVRRSPPRRAPLQQEPARPFGQAKMAGPDRKRRGNLRPARTQSLFGSRFAEGYAFARRRSDKARLQVCP